MSKRKRHRSKSESQHEDRQTLKKHKSDSELLSRASAADRTEGGTLLGDFSRSPSLPTVSGREQDLAYIAPQTMLDLLTAARTHNVIIIDCRYGYEYDGGHIAGAKNCSTEAAIQQALLQENKRGHIIIFHCEFSMERGPKMLRYLRQQDRALNINNYPSLHYPELYLLKGGYKAFWEHCQLTDSTHLCEPQAYRRMLASGFEDELKKHQLVESSSSSKPRVAAEPCQKQRASRGGRRLRKALMFEE